MDSKVEKKVVVVGKYCVGKTSLICRFTNKTFNERAPYETVSSYFTVNIFYFVIHSSIL